ncbi:MAG TPA: hypothetical protein PKW15_05265 [Alphaproteobacteria bacterium]|nr:hypothetical protein [Rhodospirillaceae bacterium]HRJ12635.1 hypothetical protein [Alphaproteobacteria bacterium]
MLTKKQAALQTGLHITEIEIGINAALRARLQADAGYSNFWVGAAFFAHEKAIFTGSNWETAADNGMCAEGTALGTLRHSNMPPENVRAVFVVGAPRDSEAAIECTPCGGCRDRMTEYLSPDTWIISVGVDGSIFAVHKLKDLHPTRYIDLRTEIDIPDSASNFSILLNRLHHLDKNSLDAYTPYHPGNNARLTIYGTDIFDGEDYCQFTAATIQNASYTLATDPAGILQANAQHHGLMRTDLICYELLTPEAMPSAATYQRLREFCEIDASLVIINAANKTVWSGTLGKALPHSFGPDNVNAVPKAQPEPPPQFPSN